jgi:hypothetical protein
LECRQLGQSAKSIEVEEKDPWSEYTIFVFRDLASVSAVFQMTPFFPNYFLTPETFFFWLF